MFVCCAFCFALEWISVITRKKNEPNFFIMTFNQNDEQYLTLVKNTLKAIMSNMDFFVALEIIFQY